MTSANPFPSLPDVPSFELTSRSFQDGETLHPAQRSGRLHAGGADDSPQLSWNGAPAGTGSFAVTVFDPDAPGAGGYWHWAVVNIPADERERANQAPREPERLVAMRETWLAWNAGMPPIPDDATVSLGYSVKDMPQR